MKDNKKYAYCTTKSQGKAPRIAPQRVTFALLLALLGLSGVATFVLASDVSNAGYRGRVTISNNSTDATNVCAAFDLNTQSLINTNKLNSSASDCAMQVAAGTDTAFMPSVNSSFPWVTWVGAINEDETLYQYLYTSGVTGGKLRYFPGEGGMTTPDSASLELSDNFTIEQKGRVDFSQIGDNLTNKTSAIRVYISGSSNITCLVPGGTSDVTPTGHNDGAGQWSNETNAYDDNDGTQATDIIAASSWSAFLDFTHSEITVDAIKAKADVQLGSTDEIDVDVYYDGGWHDGYQGSYDNGNWDTFVLPSAQAVTACRIRINNTFGGGNRDGYIYEVDFRQLNQDIVTADGLSSGEVKWAVSGNVSALGIYIDDALKDTTSLTSGVPDNSANYTFISGGVMPYMEYQKIWVDGVLQQHIEWEYDDTFTDLSGNSHDATPTFRAASSNADVSANLTSFVGIMDTTPPPAAGQTGWSILPDVPASPTGFFTEFNPEDMTFWGSGYIAEFHTNTGIPLALIVFPYAFGLAIGFGFLAWYISSGGGKNKHGRGSLLAMAITTLIVMIYFVYGAGGVIPGWILLPFGIEVLVFIVWRQTSSPF